MFIDPTASISSCSGTVLKFSVRVVRRLSRWTWSAIVCAALLHGLHFKLLDGVLHALDVLAQDGILFLQFCGLLAELSQFAFPSYNKMSGLDYINTDVFTCISFIFKGENLIIIQCFVRISSSCISVLVLKKITCFNCISNSFIKNNMRNKVDQRERYLRPNVAKFIWNSNSS